MSTVTLPTATQPFTIVEDFEDTDYQFTFSFSHVSAANWVRAATNPHGGSWTFVSAALADVGDSATWNVHLPEGAESFSFWMRRGNNPTSGTELLNVYVDGVVVIEPADFTANFTHTQFTLDVTGASVVTFVVTKETPSAATMNINVDDIICTGSRTVSPVPDPRELTEAEQLATHRVSAVRLDILTATEADAGTLTGVTGGKVTYTSAKSVHGSMDLRVVDNGQTIDWLTARLRPVYTIEGVGDTTLGVFLAGEAPEDWGGTGRVWTVKLLDKCTILDQDKVATTYTVDAGAVVTDEVVTLIESTGETNIAVTPSAATLVNPLAWPAGTTKLQIINDLLSVINYFSLFTNGDGQFRAEPYVKPASRPIVWEFLDGDAAIFLPTLAKDVDLFAIPNTVIASTTGDGTTAALSSTAINADASSPYSTVSRGRTIAYSETGIEADSQATLDAYAERRLIELTTPTASIEVAHAFVPAISFNRAVRFRREPMGIDGRHVVSKTEISLDPTALAKSTLTEVVDL